MTKYYNFVLVLLFSFLVSGCANNEDSGDKTLGTVYPDNFRIVVRANINTIFNEQIFAVQNDVYYYKYQEYTAGFASTDTMMVQYVGVKSDDQFTSYNYDDVSGWYAASSIDFVEVWSNLNTYCSTTPNFAFTEEEREADSTVNGTLCYTYLIAGVTYKISKDQYHIEWLFDATSEGYSLVYEVQSFTTSNCFVGVPTFNLPTA